MCNVINPIILFGLSDPISTRYSQNSFACSYVCFRIVYINISTGRNDRKKLAKKWRTTSRRSEYEIGLCTMKIEWVTKTAIHNAHAFRSEHIYTIRIRIMNMKWNTKRYGYSYLISLVLLPCMIRLRTTKWRNGPKEPITGHDCCSKVRRNEKTVRRKRDYVKIRKYAKEICETRYDIELIQMRMTKYEICVHFDIPVIKWRKLSPLTL